MKKQTWLAVSTVVLSLSLSRIGLAEDLKQASSPDQVPGEQGIAKTYIAGGGIEDPAASIAEIVKAGGRAGGPEVLRSGRNFESALPTREKAALNQLRQAADQPVSYAGSREAVGEGNRKSEDVSVAGSEQSFDIGEATPKRYTFGRGVEGPGEDGGRGVAVVGSEPSFETHVDNSANDGKFHPEALGGALGVIGLVLLLLLL